ncbi:type II toxin-antitoxin system RelE/ParE family toxin [Dyadobacter sp. MSC1_007]|jgi:mRNA-degrading endonuclease RelE of RelBE toxin-antitoxin system|uniref:type II toxin-antitoxin system RelE/ParE family toxin n=1 Tax=Dyadobacter sp. MSC1_007 TaxID=2909264 RepID=UPI002030B8D0|nr:type II toxin-antitoxin system RelE/ParE family toxin [Dyadobacter sp. MSC1_007]
MTKITFVPHFKKEFKRLSEKFPSLEADMKELISQLGRKPDLGTPLGGNAFKIRWQVKSKGKGKSGGVRVITYYITEDGELYLLTIYDKSEQESITPKQIRTLIETIFN